LLVGRYELTTLAMLLATPLCGFL